MAGLLEQQIHVICHIYRYTYPNNQLTTFTYGLYLVIIDKQGTHMDVCVLGELVHFY